MIFGRPEDFERLDLRIVGDVVEVVHRAVPDGVPVERRRDLRVGARLQHLGEHARDLVAVLVRMERLDRAQLVAVERLGELGQRIGRNRHLGVLALVNAIGRVVIPGREVRVAVDDLAARPRRHEDRQRLGLQVEASGEQRAFDPRPFAGRELAHVGRHDAHREQRAGVLVDDRRADRLGLAVLVAGRAHQAGPRLDDEVLRLAREHRTLAAPTGAARVDDVRLALLDVFVAEAEPVHHAGAEVLDHHVGLLDQRQDRSRGLRAT